MNYKKKLLSYLLILGSFAAYAQATYSYIPLALDSGNYWREQEQKTFSFQTSCFDFQHIIEKDTIINGMKYSIIRKMGYERDVPFLNCGNIVDSFNYRRGFIRNDTINQNVYYLNPNIGINQDTLLYSFDQSVGDTLPDTYISNGIQLVDSLDTIMVNGTPRERFFLDDLCQGNDPVFIIEGIGSNSGLLYDLSCSLCCFSSLLCLNDQGQTIYPSTSTSCNLITSINESKKSYQFTISPNPTNGQLNFKTTETLQSIEVYNLQGKKVQEINPEKRSWQLPRESGLYLVRVTTEDGEIISKKVVKR